MEKFQDLVSELKKKVWERVSDSDTNHSWIPGNSFQELIKETVLTEDKTNNRDVYPRY